MTQHQYKTFIMAVNSFLYLKRDFEENGKYLNSEEAAKLEEIAELLRKKKTEAQNILLCARRRALNKVI